MAPLKLVVLGILVVALDLDVGAVDLFLDPVGYAVVVAGVHRLGAVHQGLVRARAAALAGFVASVLTALLRRTETVVTDHGLGLTTTTTGRLVEPLLPTLAAVAGVGGPGPDGSGTLVGAVLLVPLLVLAATALGLWFLVVLVRAAREPGLDGRPPATVVHA